MNSKAAMKQNDRVMDIHFVSLDPLFYLSLN